MNKLARDHADAGAADGAAPDELPVARLHSLDDQAAAPDLDEAGQHLLDEMDTELEFGATQVDAALAEGLWAAPSTPAHADGGVAPSTPAHADGGHDQDQGARLDVGASSNQKPVQAWYIVVAQSISRFSPGLIKKLEHSKIIPFLSEWCMTPKAAQAGIADKDCIILYDVDGMPVKYLQDKVNEAGQTVSARTSAQNLYIGIERTLLDAVDPVLQAAMDRLETIFSETFWAIPAAFE